MAIIEDPQRIGVQPSNRYIREFKADLPTPDLSGVQRISAALSNVAEENLKQDADLRSKEWSYSQKLQRDEDGNYIKPVLPDGFGPYARNKSNELLDERMIQTTYYDMQPELDKIRNHPDNMRDPERTSVLMNSYIESRIKGLPPAIGERLRPLALREVQERVNHVALRSAEEARARSIKDLEKTQDLHFKNIFELTALGTEEALAKAKDLIAASARITGVLIGQKAESPEGAKLVEEALQSLQEGGNIFAVLKAQFEQGSLHSKHLTDISRILNSGGTEGENVFGVTPENIIARMPNPEVRKSLAAKIDDFHSKVIDRDRISAEEATYNSIKQIVDTGGSLSKPFDMSPSVWARYVLRLSQDYGINPNTPEGMNQLQAKIGSLPDEYYKDLFAKNIRAGKFEQLLELYQHIENFPDRNNLTADLSGELLNSSDHSLMYNYSLYRLQGKSSNDAINSARTAVANGFTATGNTAAAELAMENFLIGAFRAAGKTYATRDDFFSYVQTKMNELNPSWYEGGPKIKLADMVAGSRDQFYGLIKRSIAEGVELDAAVSFGVAKIKENYTTSSYDISYAKARQQAEFYNGKSENPMIRRNQVAPSIIDPMNPAVKSNAYVERYVAELINQSSSKPDVGKMGSTDYKSKYIDKFGNAQTYARSDNSPLNLKLKVLNDSAQKRDLPEDAKLGVNVFLRNTGSSYGDFHLIYFDPKNKSLAEAIITYDNNSAVTVNFNKVAQENDIYIRDKIRQSASTKTPWIPTIEGMINRRDRTNIYKEVDVRDILPIGGIPNSTGGSNTISPAPKPTKANLPTGLINPAFSDKIAADKNVDVTNMRPELKVFVQEIQKGFPVVLTSGYRDPFRNAQVGGAEDSEHLRGNAMDFRLVGMTDPEKDRFIKHVLSNPNVGGIGMYQNGSIHIDYRDPNNKAAWGQNRSNTSLPATPWWFQNNVKPWMNNKVNTNG